MCCKEVDTLGPRRGSRETRFRKGEINVCRVHASVHSYMYTFQIIAEPGRYVVASAFTLATNIIAKREVTDDNGSLVSIMYYINDGIYGSFNCVLYDHQSVSPVLLKVM